MNVEKIVMAGGNNNQLIFEINTCVLKETSQSFYSTEYSQWGNVSYRPVITATSTKLTKIETLPSGNKVKAWFIYKKFHY